jgi:hypothetical protein
MVNTYNTEKQATSSSNQTTWKKIKIAKKEVEVYVGYMPGYGACLFYAAAVSALLQVLDDDVAFGNLFALLFAQQDDSDCECIYDEGPSVKATRELLQKYSVSPSVGLLRNKAFQKLIDCHLRPKVAEFIQKHKNNQPKADNLPPNRTYQESLVGKWPTQKEADDKFDAAVYRLKTDRTEWCGLTVLSALSEMLESPVYQHEVKDKQLKVRTILDHGYVKPAISVLHVNRDHYNCLVPRECMKLKPQAFSTKNSNNQNLPAYTVDSAQETLIQFRHFSQKEAEDLEEHQSAIKKTIEDEARELTTKSEKGDRDELETKLSKNKKQEEALRLKIAGLNDAINKNNEFISHFLTKAHNLSAETASNLGTEGAKSQTEALDGNIEVLRRHDMEDGELQKKAARRLNLDKELEQAEKEHEKVSTLSGTLKAEMDALDKKIAACQKDLEKFAAEKEKEQTAITAEEAKLKEIKGEKDKAQTELSSLKVESKNYRSQQATSEQALKKEKEKNKSIFLEVFTSSGKASEKKGAYVKIDGRKLELDRTIKDELAHTQSLLIAFIDTKTGKKTFFGNYSLIDQDDLRNATSKIRQFPSNNHIIVASIWGQETFWFWMAWSFVFAVRKDLMSVLQGLGSQVLYSGFMGQGSQKNLGHYYLGNQYSGYFISGSGVPQGRKEYYSNSGATKTEALHIPTPQRQAAIEKQLKDLKSARDKKIEQYKKKEKQLEETIGKTETSIIQKQKTIADHQAALSQNQINASRSKKEEKSCIEKKKEKDVLFDSATLRCMQYREKENKLRAALGQKIKEKTASEPEKSQAEIFEGIVRKLKPLKEEKKQCEKALVAINDSIRQTELDLTRVSQRVKDFKAAREKAIKVLEKEQAACEGNKAYLNETLKDSLDMRLLMNDKALTGYAAKKTLPEANQFIIAILQFIYECYADYDLKLEDNTNYPEEWQETIKAVLKYANILPDKPLTQETAAKIVEGINKVYAGDNIRVDVRWHHDGKVTQLGDRNQSNLSVNILQYQHHFLGLIKSDQFYTEEARARVLFQYMIASTGLLADLCEARCGIQASKTVSSQVISNAFDTQLQQCNEAKRFQDWNENIDEKIISKDSKAAFVLQLLHWLATYEKRCKKHGSTVCETFFKRFIEQYDYSLRACVKKEFKRRQEDCQASIDANPTKRLEAKIRAIKQEILKKEKERDVNNQTIKTKEQEKKEFDKMSSHVDLIHQSRLEHIQEKMKSLKEKAQNIADRLLKYETSSKQASAEVDKLNQERDIITDKETSLEKEKQSIQQELKKVEREYNVLGSKTREEKEKEDIALNKQERALASQSVIEANMHRLGVMLDFIQTIQEAVKDNREFFDKRAVLRTEIDNFLGKKAASHFPKLYQFIVGSGKKQAGLTTLKSDEVEQLEEALKKESKFYLEVLNLLKQAVEKPKLSPYPSESKLEISGQSLSWKDCMTALRAKMQKQLNVFGLALNTKDQLYVQDKTLLGGDITSFPDKLQPLFKRRIRTKYPYDQRQSGWPEEKASDEALVKLVTELEINFYDVLASYYKTIEIVTGHHLYIDDNISLPGINLSFFSKHNISLKKDCKIDTSGKDAPKYTDKKARNGEFYRVDKATPLGKNGDNGGNGYAGQNAGHIFMKAKNEIVNLETLNCKAVGGKGEDGQIGGDGDQGVEGKMTPNAKAEDTGHWCEQSYLAVAWYSGIRRNGKINYVEVSGPGGHAGLTGLGGSGGRCGGITLEDKQHTVQFLEDGQEIEVQPLNKLAKFKANLQISAGKPGDDLKESGKGGEAGKAGLMGLDHSQYKKGFWYSTKERHGQLSQAWVKNLAAISVGENGSNDATLLFLAGPVYGFLRALGFLAPDINVVADSDRYQQQLKIVHASYDPSPEFRKMHGKERRSPYEKSRGKKGELGHKRDKNTRNQAEKNTNPSQENQQYRQILQARATRVDQSYHQLVSTFSARIQRSTKALKQEHAVLEEKLQAYATDISESQQRLKGLNATSAKTKAHLAEIEQKANRIAEQIDAQSKNKSKLDQKLLASLEKASQRQTALFAMRADLTCAEIDINSQSLFQQHVSQLCDRLQKMLQLLQDEKSEDISQQKEKNSQLSAEIEGLKEEIAVLVNTDEKAKKDREALENHLAHINQATLSNNESEQVREQVQIDVEYEGHKKKKSLALDGGQLTKNTQLKQEKNKRDKDDQPHQICLNGVRLRKAYKALGATKADDNASFVTLFSLFCRQCSKLAKTKLAACFYFLQALARYIGEEGCSNDEVVRLWKQLDALVSLIKSSSSLKEGRATFLKLLTELYFVVNQKSVKLLEARCAEGEKEPAPPNIKTKLQQKLCNVNLQVNKDIFREIRLKKVFYQSVFNKNKGWKGWKGRKLASLLEFIPLIHAYSFEKKGKARLIKMFQSSAKALGLKLGACKNIDVLYLQCVLSLMGTRIEEDQRAEKKELKFTDLVKNKFHEKITNLFKMVDFKEVKPLPEMNLLKQWFYFLRDECLTSEKIMSSRELLKLTKDPKKLAKTLLDVNKRIKAFPLSDEGHQSAFEDCLGKINLELPEKLNCIESLLTFDEIPLDIINSLLAGLYIKDEKTVKLIVDCLEKVEKKCHSSGLCQNAFLNRQLALLLHSQAGSLSDFSEADMKLCLSELRTSTHQLIKMKSILTLQEMLSAIFSLLKIRETHIVQLQKRPLFQKAIKKETDSWKEKCHTYLVRKFNIEKEDGMIVEEKLFSAMLTCEEKQETLADYFELYLYCMGASFGENKIEKLGKLEQAIIAVKTQLFGKNLEPAMFKKWLAFIEKVDNFIDASYLDCLQTKAGNIRSKLEEKTIKLSNLTTPTQQFSQYFTVAQTKLRHQKKRMIEFLIKKLFTLEEDLPESHSFEDLLSKVNCAGWDKLKLNTKNQKSFIGNTWENLPKNLSSQNDLESIFSAWDGFMNSHKAALLAGSDQLSDDFKAFVGDSRMLFRTVLFDKKEYQGKLGAWSDELAIAIKEEAWQKRGKDIKVLEDLYRILECAHYQKNNYGNVSDLADDFAKQDLSAEQAQSLNAFTRLCLVKFEPILNAQSFVNNKKQTRASLFNKIEKALTKQQVEENPVACFKLIQSLVNKEEEALTNDNAQHSEKPSATISKQIKLAKEKFDSDHIEDAAAIIKSLVCFLFFKAKDIQSLKALLPLDQWACYQSQTMNFYLETGFRIADERARGLLFASLKCSPKLYAYKKQLDKMMRLPLVKQLPRRHLALWIQLALAAERKESNFDSVMRSFFPTSDKAVITWQSIKKAIFTDGDKLSREKNETMLFLISILPLCSETLLSSKSRRNITGKFIESLEKRPNKPTHLMSALLVIILQDCENLLKQKTLVPLLQTRLMKVLYVIAADYHALTEDAQDGRLKILQAFRDFFIKNTSNTQNTFMKNWLGFVKSRCKGMKVRELFSLLLEDDKQLFLAVSPLRDKEKALGEILSKEPVGLWVSELQKSYWKALGDDWFGHLRLPSHADDKQWTDLKQSESYIATKRAYQDFFLELKQEIADSDVSKVDEVWACKEQLLLSYSIATSENQMSAWFELIAQLNKKRADASFTLSLKNITRILSSAHHFSSLDLLVSIIKNAPDNQVTQTVLYERIKQRLGGTQGDKGAKTIQFDALIDPVFSSKDGLRFLAAFVKMLSKRRLKQRNDSEVAMLNQLIEQAIKLKVYKNKDLVDKLASHAIEFWPMWMRRERIKGPLQLDMSNLSHVALVDELVRLEKETGVETTKKWINFLKQQVVLPIVIIKKITNKFSSKQWVLNDSVFKRLKEDTSIEKWDAALVEHHKNLGQERKPEELVQLMLADGIGMNDGVNHLLKGGESSSMIKLMEKTKEKYEALKADFEKAGLKEEDGLKNAIVKLKQQIKEASGRDEKTENQDKKSKDKGAEQSSENREYFLQTNKGDAWVNFLALLMHAVKRAYNFIPRDTQLIAMLAFFDSFQSDRGRLANISTSEGKSLVTQMLSIACAFRGEQVDILTSSKELAERDAREAKPLLNLFGVQVTNNCDMQCDDSEDERTLRYAENQVIYGDAGSFQKDLLLTRHFDRDIRKKSGTRLVLDEADLMLIDNSDRTLYISHNLDDFVHLRTLFVAIWHCVNSEDCALDSKRNRNKVEKLISQKMREGVIETPKTLKKFIKNRLAVWIQSAYSAKALEAGKPYTFVNKPKYLGRPMIVDLATGVEQANSQWSNGLHQFLQLKHRGKLTKESLRAIFISNLTFFQEYGQNICGMSGTIGLKAEMDLLDKTYHVDFFKLPRFKREQYTQEVASIVGTDKEWLSAISADVDEKMAMPKKAEGAEVEKKKREEMLDQIQASILSAKAKWPKLPKRNKAATKEKTANEKETLPEKLQIAINKLDDFLQQLLDEKSRLKREWGETKKRIKVLDKSIRALKGVLCQDSDDIEKRRDELKSKKDLEADRTEQYKAIATIKAKLSALHKVILQFSCQKENALCLQENKRERAVLIICEDQMSAESVVAEMKKKFPNKTVLSYVSYYEELNLKQVLPGTIIVATNIAGRGTDLKVSDVIDDGLHVILSYLPPSIRTEIQALRRTARKGRKGSGHLIVRDERAKDICLSIELLRDERDAAESKRLKDFLDTKIGRLKLEQELFTHFVSLQEEIKTSFRAKGFNPQFILLQIKSLQDHWAYWLEEHEKTIKSLDKKELFDAFEVFAAKMRTDQVEKEYGLISEPAELIKLGCYYLAMQEWKKARACYDHTIKLEPDFSGFAYYYKARSILEFGYSFEEKQEARKALENASKLLQTEVDRLMTCSKLIGLVSGHAKDKGEGLGVDYFTESNTHKISALTVHLNAIKRILGSPLTSESFRSGPIVREESAQIVFNNLRKLLPSQIKDYRIDQAAEVRYDLETKQKEIYYKNEDKIERVSFPVPFMYCKEEIIKQIEENAKQGNENARQVDFEKWRPFIFSQETILKSSFLSKTTNVLLDENAEKQSRGSVFWDLDIFNKQGEKIKKHIVAYGDSKLDEMGLINYLKEIQGSTGELNWDKVKNALVGQRIIHVKQSHTLNKKVKKAINTCMGELCFKQEDLVNALKKVAHLPLEKYPEFVDDQAFLTEELTSALKEKNKTLTKDDLKLDGAAFRKLYMLLYSRGFLQVGLIKALKLKEETTLPVCQHAMFESCLIALSKQENIDLSGLSLPKDAQAGTMSLWHFMKARHVALNPIVNFPVSAEYNRCAETYFNRMKNEVKNKLRSILEGGRYYLTFSPLNDEEKNDIQQGTAIVFEYHGNGWLIHFANEENKLLEKPIVKQEHLDLLNELKDEALLKQKKQDNEKPSFLYQEESEESKLSRLSKITIDYKHDQFNKLKELATSFGKLNILKGMPDLNREDNEACKEAICSALESAIGSLQMLAKLKLEPKELSKYFEAGKVPPEILDYMRRCCADVLNLVKDTSGWDWGAFFCAILGLVQIVAGILVTALGMPVLGKMLISEGVGDVCFAVQSAIAGNFSWEAYGEYKLQSLLLTIACAGVCSAFSESITNLGDFVKSSDSFSFSQAIIGEVCADFVDAGISMAVSSAASAFSENLAKSAFLETRKAQRKYFEVRRKEYIEGPMNDRIRALYNCLGSGNATRKIHHILSTLNAGASADIFDSMLNFTQSFSAGLAKFSSVGKGGKFGALLKVVNPLSKILGVVGCQKAMLDIHLKTERLFDELCVKLDEAAKEARDNPQQLAREVVNYSNEEINGETSKVFDMLLAQVENLLAKACAKTSTTFINFALEGPRQKIRGKIAGNMQTIYAREHDYRTQQDNIRIAAHKAAEVEKNNTKERASSAQAQEAASLSDQNVVLKTKEGEVDAEELTKTFGEKNAYVVKKGDENYLVEPTQSDLEQQVANQEMAGNIGLQAHATSSESNIILLDSDTYASSDQSHEPVRGFDGAPSDKRYSLVYQDGNYMPCIQENGAWKIVDIGLSSIAGNNNLARAMVFLKEYHDNDQSIDNAISAAKDTTKTEICARQAADQIANREMSPFEVENTQKESTLIDYTLAEAPDAMSYQKGKASSPVDQFIEKTISDLSDVDSLVPKQKLSDAPLLSRVEQSQKEPLREQNISETGNTAMKMFTGAFKKIIGVFSCAPLHAGSEMAGDGKSFEHNDAVENYNLENKQSLIKTQSTEEPLQTRSDGITMMPHDQMVNLSAQNDLLNPSSDMSSMLPKNYNPKSMMPSKQIDETLIQALQQARETIDSKTKSSSDAKKNQTSKSILAIIDKTQSDLFGKVIENSDGNLAKKVMKGKIALVSFLLNLSQKSEINQTSVGDAAIETGNGVLLGIIITKLAGSAAAPVSWGLLLNDIADSLYYDGPAHNQFKKNAHLVRKELVNKLKNNKDSNGLKKLASDVLTALSMQQQDSALFTIEMSHKLAELQRWISTLLTSESSKQANTAPTGKGKGKASDQDSRFQNTALDGQSKEHYDEENKQCVEEPLHSNLNEKSELPESGVLPDNGNQQSTTSKITKKLTLSSKAVLGENKVSRKSKVNMLRSKAEMERIKKKFGFGQKEYDALTINESVYNRDPSKPTKIRSWKRVWTSDNAQLTSKGYYGEAWVNTETGECMVAHRGSLSDFNQEAYYNWAKSNKDIFFNKIPFDQENAANFSDSVRNKLGLNLTFIETGHSKGGVNAGLNAVRHGCEAILFDSPGFRESAQNLYQQSLREPDNMINYKLKNNAINSCNYFSCKDRSMIKEKKLGLPKNATWGTKYNPLYGAHPLDNFVDRFNENPEIAQNNHKQKAENRPYVESKRQKHPAYQEKTNLFKSKKTQQSMQKKVQSSKKPVTANNVHTFSSSFHKPKPQQTKQLSVLDRVKKYNNKVQSSKGTKSPVAANSVHTSKVSFHKRRQEIQSKIAELMKNHAG